MTLHRLQVLPRDVAAEALGLLLDAPAPPTLAELVLRSGEGELVLGVLGASHAVTATTTAGRLTEQVSCDAVAAGGRPLPRSARSGGYRMTSESGTVPVAELAATAAELRDRAAGDPAWICGAFPGDAAALTALTGSPVDGGWTWRTWHLYPGPEEGVIVTTRSRWTPKRVGGVRRLAAGAVLLLLALTGCGAGSSVRGFLDDTFDEQSSAGDTSTYLAAAPVAATASQITGAVQPITRATDAGTEYLRYDDDIVVVSGSGGGSEVRVEDLDGAYRDGSYAYLGPGFTPGSPAETGDDPDDVK